ncbi:MAG: sulfite exporter TauE/SafE family protein [Acidimicrobiaceae bacterium]|nr:sulfite exporter TauE/SafE family protein [Acidimicrobiaceae bacterium]
MSLPTILSNVLLVWRNRHALGNTQHLPVLAATAVAGTVLGTFVLVSAPEEPLVGLVVASVLIYAARVLWFRDAHVSTGSARRATPAVGAAAGVLQGTLGMPGPLLASWFHACRLRGDAYVLSLTSLFLISGVSQFTTQIAVGAYSRERLAAAAVAVVPVIALTPVGERLRQRLSQQAFDLIVLAVLAAAAVSLLLRVLA